MENQPRHFFRYADFVERFGLRFENGGVPAARKERRIGAEEQALRACDIQRAPENGAQIECASSYRIQLLLLEVSRYTFGHRSHSISASRRYPAPK